MDLSTEVVVAFDFTPSSQHALEHAIEVAPRTPKHVLHVVSILDTRGTLRASRASGMDRDSAEAVQRHVQERVSAVLAGRPPNHMRVFVHARGGKPADEILALAAEVGADVIYIGSHGLTGLERLLLGSVSERVVREARCPVMVVRARTYPRVDGLPRAEQLQLASDR